MEILDIIIKVMGLFAYVAAIGFAITAWFRLRRIQRDVDNIHDVLAVVASMTAGIHVKAAFSEINDMKQALRHLVDDEQFEEAEKLQEIISSAEKNIMAEIEKMNDTFGDFAEIRVKKVQRRPF